MTECVSSLISSLLSLRQWWADSHTADRTLWLQQHTLTSVTVSLHVHKHILFMLNDTQADICWRVFVYRQNNIKVTKQHTNYMILQSTLCMYCVCNQAREWISVCIWWYAQNIPIWVRGQMYACICWKTHGALADWECVCVSTVHMAYAVLPGVW